MANLLQDVDFLENFAARVLILDVHFVNALNCNILAGQFVDAQRDLAECTFAQQFDEAIKVKRRVWDLSMLLHVGFDVANELIAFLCHRIIQNHFLFLRRSVHGRWSFLGVNLRCDIIIEADDILSEWPLLR